jgi:DNA-binding MarR family transcriptional regulator
VSFLESNILREVGALSRSVQTISDTRFRKHCLQKGQFIFITRIFENVGINLIDLTQMLNVDKTTTTKAVQKLIQTGFIEKKRDNADKRMWNLYPKQKLIELYPLIIAEENKNIRICFETLSEDEKVLVYQCIKKMRDNLDKYYQNGEVKNNGANHGI